MGTEFKFGLTERGTRANGDAIRPMVRASSGMWMVTCLTESGRTIKRTAMECTHIRMELSMKDTGRMTYKMDGAWKPGLMGPSMRDTTKRARSTEMAPIRGMMDRAMWETGTKTK